MLSGMAPKRAEQAVRLVGLPADEETAVLAVDLVVARSRIVPFYRYNFVLYYQYRMSGFSR